MDSRLETACDRRVAYLELAPTSTAPFWARWQTRIVLDWWGVSSESLETVALLVSEMVTNATKLCSSEAVDQNARPTSTDPISLTLTDLGGRVRIEVGDSNPEPPRLCDMGPDAESGRGLMLVEALSTEWSYFYSSAGRKVVYAIVEVVPARAVRREEAGGKS
jgi:anti-sigma regulatory factor (Ser/Thr protein kinase)